MNTHVRLQKELLRKQARRLRTLGKSYSQITEKLGVAKSTLNGWFRGLPPSPHQTPQAMRLRFLRISAMGAEANRQLRLKRLAKAEIEVRHLMRGLPARRSDTLLSLLAMIYWAEGSKDPHSGIVFVNTDPEMMLLFITLLRKCFTIDEKRIHVRLHIHYYHHPKEVVEYWSRLLDVPLEQFGKLYHKKRSETKKFRQNFMGICFIQYGDTLIKNKLLFAAKEVRRKVVVR